MWGAWSPMRSIRPWDGVAVALGCAVSGCLFGYLVLHTDVALAQIQSLQPVAAGGTGDTALTAFNVLIGANKSPVQFSAPVGTGNCFMDNGVSAKPTFQACPGGSTQLHSITFVLNGGGSTIATGNTNSYPPVDFACTIFRIDISGNPSGSLALDVWKAAGAIPTSANIISASAPITLSSSQLAQNGSLTGWSTSVSIG